MQIFIKFYFCLWEISQLFDEKKTSSALILLSLFRSSSRALIWHHCLCERLLLLFTRFVFLYSFLFVLHTFAEEQERVQKKTFTNWINSYLSKVSNFPYSKLFFILFLLSVSTHSAVYSRMKLAEKYSGSWFIVESKLINIFRVSHCVKIK